MPCFDEERPPYEGVVLRFERVERQATLMERLSLRKWFLKQNRTYISFHIECVCRQHPYKSMIPFAQIYCILCISNTQIYIVYIYMYLYK